MKIGDVDPLTLNNQLKKKNDEEFYYLYKSNYLFIEAVSYIKDDHKWFENNKYILIVLGDIFFRRNVNCSSFVPEPQIIIDTLINNKNPFMLFKGNYWIILHKKDSHSVMIISDPLSLLPLYISKVNHNIIISTNLSKYKINNWKINSRVVLENIIFNQPLSNNTIIDNVDYLKTGLIYNINETTISYYNEYKLDNIIFNNKKYPLDIDELINDFNHSVLSYAKKSEMNLVSLTGGFDSRSIVSVFLKYNLPLTTFSFGREGGLNTIVPLMIKDRLGINHIPFYLDYNYENCYSYYAEEVIYWSDALSIFERANYLYVDKKLKENYTNYISGLVGGEIFAPMTMYVPFCSQYYSDIFYKGQSFNIDDALYNNKLKSFVNFIEPGTLSSLEDFINDKQKYINKLKTLESGYLYYIYDFIDTGFRTFYGGQIHTERSYIENNTPFYNLDILERIMFSERKKVFKKPFRGNPFWKRKNRILQATIINKNYPELANIPTDRGFAPADILSFKGQLKSAILYLKNENNLKKTPKEFISNKWSKLYYNYILNNNIKINNELFNAENIINYLKSYNENKYNQSFNRLLSISRWLSM